MLMPVLQRSTADRWIPFGVASVVVGAGVFLASPERRQFIPPCPFKAVTGLDCPGCGAARSLVAVSEREFAAAFDHNLLVPFAAVAVVLAWARWTAAGFGHRIWSPLAGSRASVVVLVTVLTFWVLRLLPFPPFEVLAADRRLG